MYAVTNQVMLLQVIYIYLSSIHLGYGLKLVTTEVHSMEVFENRCRFEGGQLVGVEEEA